MCVILTKTDSRWTTRSDLDCAPDSHRPPHATLPLQKFEPLQVGTSASIEPQSLESALYF